nr:SDR family NAD(P)-dependent oxidoreductase [Bacillus wiedmannii]
MSSFYKGSEIISIKSDSSYLLDFNEESDQTRLIEEIFSNGKKIIGFVDLSDLHPINLNKCINNIGKITFLQRLIKKVTEIEYPFTILHFTKGLQSYNIDSSSLAGADFAGLIRMLGAEYRQLKSRTIDIDLSLGDVKGITEIIFNEIRMENNSCEVCYRHGNRYISYMKEVENIDQPFKDTWTNLIKNDKVLVITGGTRGIGAEIAKYLVNNQVKKLILMGREEFPPRNKWLSLIENKKVNKELEDKMRMIMEFEDRDVDVEVYTGSLSEKKELQEYFKHVRRNMGEIGGVIHCAGLNIVENPSFINKDINTIQKVFEPKITGLQNLHEIFAEDKLEFFVLFSSVSATIPLLGVGTSDYATANAFMDYFAQYQHSLGNNYYKSINWPCWKGTGMGEVTSPIYHKMGFVSHNISEGILLLENSMGHQSIPCILPCIVNKEKFEYDVLLKDKYEKNDLNHVGIDNSLDIKLDESSKSLVIKNELKQLFSKELKIPKDRLNEETSFEEFGVDSIILAELVKKIEKLVRKKLDPSILLEFSTIKSLGNHLMNYGDISLKKLNKDSEGKDKKISVFSDDRKKDLVNEIKPSKDTYRKIAVIGMGCNFPGQAKNVDIFWNNLVQGESGITEVPDSRWSVNKLYSPTYQKGKSISKWGGFIEDIEYFDPKYFGISEEDASNIDPLIKQFLEVTVHTIRHAGYDCKELWNEKVGVFVGSRAGDYAARVKEPQKNTIVGIGQNFIAAHVSHFLNLKGPNMVVDTACSSSLVSIHLACQSLILNECEIALAGGVDILLNEKPYVVLSEGRALSPNGRCHTFDKNADGFVPGEGCGAVLLKPLDKAIEDGDQVYAVIEASAVNNDGHTMGITTPNPESQSLVIEDALSKGDINPDSVSYIEVHGTGTMIGDPIELRALNKVFTSNTAELQFCGLGSVKSNIGHLLSAAGIASFIKVVLSLYYKKIPPTLNCKVPNPRFEFVNSPFYVNTKLKEWIPRTGVCRAGISSFGFGGTNAHIIVRDTTHLPNKQVKRKPKEHWEFQKKRYWIDKSDSINEGNLNNSLYTPLLPLVFPQGIEKNSTHEQVSCTSIIKNDDYIVRDHLVHDVRIMPGVTLIDIIYRMLQRYGYSMNEVELKRILFMEPIATTELFDKIIEVNIRKKFDVWVVTVKSGKIKNGTSLESEYVVNMQCEVHFNKSFIKKTIDIEQLKSESYEVTHLEQLYSYAGKLGVIHGEFMRGLGDIYEGTDYLLTELNLNKLAKKHTSDFYLHPAILDASTLIPVKYTGMEQFRTKPSIPIFIESFMAANNLNNSCYVFVSRKNVTVTSSQDIFYYDIELYDKHGSIIAHFKKLGAKQIRIKNLIHSLKNIHTIKEGEGIGN